MYGSVIGDIIGSRFEFLATQETDVELLHGACCFTDDTVCLSSIAKTALFILDNSNFNKNLEKKYLEGYIKEVKFNKTNFYSKKFSDSLIEYYLKFPLVGYGQQFNLWCKTTNRKPYKSLGNGALMKIMPIPFIFKSLDESLFISELITNLTHNHEESLKMVELYIKIIWICLYTEDTIDNIKKEILLISKTYGLNILSVNEYQKIGGFMVLCKDTLERSISCLIESNNYEETVKNVLSIGSDTDTTSCIAGCLSEILYGIPDFILKKHVKYFNHKNISLIKDVNKMYLLNQNNNNFSSRTKENIFNLEKNNFYSFINTLILKDPTSEWDPLADINDMDYYSDADFKLQEKNKKLLQKIIDYFLK